MLVLLTKNFNGYKNDGIPTTNEIKVNVQTLEKCFNKRIDRKMGNIVDTVEDRIQNAYLTAIENIVTPRIELAFRSINAASGVDGASFKFKTWGTFRITASFENVSERNDIFHEFNANDDSRGNIPNEVIEFLVPRTHFEQQHTLITAVP